MKRHTLGRAPDYTNAALITLGVNLFCLLFALWAMFGFATALIAAVAGEYALRWLSRRRRR